MSEDKSEAQAMSELKSLPANSGVSEDPAEINKQLPPIKLSYNTSCGSSWGGPWSQSLLMKASIQVDFPGVTIEKEDTNPTKGAFEITSGSNLIWSKLTKYRYPSPKDVEMAMIKLGYQLKKKK